VGVLAWVEDGFVITACGGVHDLLRSTHDKAQAATDGEGKCSLEVTNSVFMFWFPYSSASRLILR